MKNIKSTYIIENIFKYAGNIMKFKIFLYSKKYQKKSNITLFDYQKIFFDKIKMNSFNKYFKYICFKHPDYEIYFNEVIYNKNNKTELLNKDLLKNNINIDDYKKYVKNYFSKYKEKFIKEINEEYLIRYNINYVERFFDRCREEERYEEGYDEFLTFNEKEEIRGFKKFCEGIKLEIDINSPLFDIFNKSEFFGELFTIPIYSKFIEEYKLKEDYINIFNKLNDINSNYLSIFFQFNDAKDISFLKDCNINFNKVKNLKIKHNIYYNSKEKNDYNLFFKEFFSLKNIENKIIDLNIQINNFYSVEIDENILENLNKFKILEHLTLNGIISKTKFELKIKTLKTLNIYESINIYINEDIGLSLKKLILPGYKYPKSLFKFPQLEFLELSEDDFSSIDLNSLNNLIKIKYYFFYKNNLNQILSIKSLKEIHIITDLNYLDQSSIDVKNPSVNKLICHCRHDDDYELNYNINELLNKFPNLTDLFFITNLRSYRIVKSVWYDSKINLEIKENLNCKINKITLILYFGDVKTYIQDFKTLQKLEIKTYNDRPTEILIFLILYLSLVIIVKLFIIL